MGSKNKLLFIKYKYKKNQDKAKPRNKISKSFKKFSNQNIVFKIKKVHIFFFNKYCPTCCPSLKRRINFPSWFTSRIFTLPVALPTKPIVYNQNINVILWPTIKSNNVSCNRQKSFSMKVHLFFIHLPNIKQSMAVSYNFD